MHFEAGALVKVEIACFFCKDQERKHARPESQFCRDVSCEIDVFQKRVRKTCEI